MTDTLERVFVLIVIILAVLFIGVGLNVFESFTTMRHERDPTTMEQTGLITDSPGNPAVVYKSTSGVVNDQYTNVPTRENVYQNVLQRYSSQIPSQSYSGGQMSENRILKSSGGPLPNVILNPASDADKQIVCKLNDTCEDYVIDRTLYCPIGMDRMETGAVGSGQRRYNGCYSGGRRIPSLGCRHGVEEANSMAGGNLCRILSQLKIQRVGSGFIMIPRYSVLKALLEKPIASLPDTERNQIIEMVNLRRNIVAQMTFSLKSQVSRSRGDKMAESQLMSYYNGLLYNTTILYQPVTDGMRMPRAGFYADGISLPALERLPQEQDYNVTAGSIGDTTKAPLPELETVVTPDVVATLPGLPIPARIEPTPPPPPPQPRPTPIPRPSIMPAKVPGPSQVTPRPAPAPGMNTDNCPIGQGRMNGQCVPATRILQELQYWTRADRRKKFMVEQGKTKYRQFMSNIRNLAERYKVASGNTFIIPPDPQLNVFEQMKYNASR